MKLVLLMSLSIIISSCSSFKNERGLASSDLDLSGTRIGVVTHKFVTKNPDYAPNKTFVHADRHRRTKMKRAKREFNTKYVTRAVRMYMSEIKGEPGNYHMLLLEYQEMFKMGLKFGASKKLPKLSKIIGFLTKINSRITVYKVTPKNNKGVYEMQKLKVVGKKLVPATEKEHSTLVLNDGSYEVKGKTLGHAMDGATVTAAGGGEPSKIFFPADSDGKDYGLQYRFATFIYEKAGLDSTWRKNFLPGPYLGAYNDIDDEVLRLTESKNENSANFKINKKRLYMSKRKREKQFTNKKSAHLIGNYSVNKPEEGMFVFTKKGEGQKGSEHVQGKIGLFIDIFDNTKKGDDVVELILVDSEKPKDFLMYYEHPDNGEGQ